MSRLNVSVSYSGKITHEGAPACNKTTIMQDLRRSVLSTFLWEDQFYEDGRSIADRIEELSLQIAPEDLAALAIEARTQHNLRHVPLLLLKTLLKTGAGKPGLVSTAIEQTINRPDEISELLAIYWKGGKKPLSGQLKKGLAKSLCKFSEYSLAKYNGKGAIKLRDILFLTHAKPKNEEQAEVWKRLAANELITPDTWEVALSGGADKKETFERLIRDGNLGYFALLRNLRNMIQAGVDPDLVKEAIEARKNGAEKILPFRFVAAARHAHQFEPSLDKALLACIEGQPKLPGKTIILIDVSGSMDGGLSGKSDMTRMVAAATLGSIINGDVRVFTFSNHLVEVPPRKGMAGVDSVINSQPHSGTELGGAISTINGMAHDRLIVITDEQSHDRVSNPICKNAYMINVASCKNGIGYGKWTHIDGFSENIIKWIYEFESMNNGF